MIYSIYLLTFPNGKKYCGYTSQDVEDRWKNGFGYQKCPLVWRAIVKYGWINISKEVIFTTTNQDLAFNKEKEVIANLNLLDPLYGYNLDIGGRPHGNSDHLTEEGRKKLSEKSKERWDNPQEREYMIRRMKEGNSYRRGVPLDEETKKKISETKKNQHRPAHNRKAVIQLDIITEEILKEFPSGSDAAKAIGKDVSSASNILAVCRGTRNTAFGYKWRFKDNG